ncbi:MAG: hypothetical protein WC655_16710 [Candidatus Hydrogenedentales bacterium]|jgi:hypothetical protein
MRRLWILWQIVRYGAIRVKCSDYKSAYSQYGVTILMRFDKDPFVPILKLEVEKPR